MGKTLRQKVNDSPVWFALGLVVATSLVTIPSTGAVIYSVQVVPLRADLARARLDGGEQIRPRPAPITQGTIRIAGDPLVVQGAGCTVNLLETEANAGRGKPFYRGHFEVYLTNGSPTRQWWLSTKSERQKFERGVETYILDVMYVGKDRAVVSVSRQEEDGTTTPMAFQPNSGVYWSYTSAPKNGKPPTRKTPMR